MATLRNCASASRKSVWTAENSDVLALTRSELVTWTVAALELRMVRAMQSSPEPCAHAHSLRSELPAAAVVDPDGHCRHAVA